MRTVSRLGRIDERGCISIAVRTLVSPKTAVIFFVYNVYSGVATAGKPGPADREACIEVTLAESMDERHRKSTLMARDQNIIQTLQSGSGLQDDELFKIDCDVVIIGRSPECEPVLESNSVSRRQAAPWPSSAATDSDFQMRQVGVTPLSFARATLVRERTIWQRGSSCSTGTG
jgi:hypothetical protein